MKRLLILALPIFFLLSCGVPAATENATFRINPAAGRSSELQVSSVWTDMRPIEGTNTAGVLFRAETVLSSGEQVTLYGGGMLEMEGADFVFKNNDAVQKEGRGRLTIAQSSEGLIIYPAKVGLTAQIDGLTAQIDGIVVSSNAKEETLEFPGVSNTSGQASVDGSSCYGRLIPGGAGGDATQLLIGDHAGHVRFAGLATFKEGTFSDFDQNSGVFTCDNDAISYSVVEQPSGGGEMIFVHISAATLNFEESGRLVDVEDGSGFYVEFDG